MSCNGVGCAWADGASAPTGEIGGWVDCVLAGNLRTSFARNVLVCWTGSGDLGDDGLRESCFAIPFPGSLSVTLFLFIFLHRFLEEASVANGVLIDAYGLLNANFDYGVMKIDELH